MHADKTDADVLVVGAGPVGLAVALALVRAGATAIVVDQGPTINDSPRAMAHLHPVLPAFESMGILGDVEAAGLRADGVNFIDMETGESFYRSLAPLVGHFSHPYAVALGQGDLGRIMLDHLEPHGVETRWGNSLVQIDQDSTGVTAVVETPNGRDTIRSHYLVGADGANSGVRRALDLDFPGFTWPDRFVATNIRYDFPAHGMKTGNWRIDPEFGAVIGRIGRGDLWRYTFRESGDLPLDSLEERIHDHFDRGGLYGGEYQLVDFAPYRMHQRCLDNFHHGRVVFAGDAAHITNPIGGMGLTGGLLDAVVLAEALAAVVDGSAEDSVLDLYAERRRRVWTDIVSPTATALKTMLFDPPPHPERETHIYADMRVLVDDPARLREAGLAQCAMATPSVLSKGVSA